MTAIEGKMLTCDVCGKSIFLRYLGDKQADGGFTKWHEYENADGWTNIHVGNIRLQNVCPECDELIQNTLAECVGRLKANYT